MYCDSQSTIIYCVVCEILESLEREIVRGKNVRIDQKDFQRERERERDEYEHS